jgi:hypothetical protein
MEADADGQHDRERERVLSEAEGAGKDASQEIVVFEESEKAQVDRQAENQKRFASPR